MVTDGPFKVQSHDVPIPFFCNVLAALETLAAGLKRLYRKVQRDKTCNTWFLGPSSQNPHATFLIQKILDSDMTAACVTLIYSSSL